MTKRPPDAKDEPAGFAESLRGVRPLAGRERLRPPPQPPDATRARPRGAATVRRFVVEASGDAVTGRAEDVSRAVLAKLRAGDAAPDREVDLHGLAARDAKRRLVHALREAHAEGSRCVLVVHGRGVHSEKPVLRSALPEWLQEAPLSELVLAFASAPRALGGSGATLVWLRRVRERAVSSAAPRRSGEQDET